MKFLTYSGAGKIETEIRRVTNRLNRKRSAKDQNADRRTIYYIIMRDEIERGDTSRFLANFGPGTDKARLRDIEGRISIAVAGYDNEPDELFTIPAVRNFFASIQRTWPCWLFLSGIQDDCLRSVMFCALKNLVVCRSHRGRRVRVDASEHAVKCFVIQSMVPAAILDSLADIPRKRGAARVDAIARYLGVPKP